MWLRYWKSSTFLITLVRSNRKRACISYFLRVIHELAAKTGPPIAWFFNESYINQVEFQPSAFCTKLLWKIIGKRQILSRLFKQRKFVQSKNWWKWQLRLAFTIIVCGRKNNAVGLITKLTWTCQVPAQIECLFSGGNSKLRPHQQP